MYPQSNGSAERMVQTVENILRKCEEDKEDPYLALLSYRATPLNNQLKSPAELLTNRKFKTRLPMYQRNPPNSRDHGATRIQFATRKEKEAQYYNQHLGPPKKQLEVDQSIRMFDHHSQTWEPGVVIQPAKEPRSFIVRANSTGATYRRTRSQLRPNTTAVSKPCCQQARDPALHQRQPQVVLPQLDMHRH